MSLVYADGEPHICDPFIPSASGSTKDAMPNTLPKLNRDFQALISGVTANRLLEEKP